MSGESNLQQAWERQNALAHHQKRLQSIQHRSSRNNVSVPHIPHRNSSVLDRTWEIERENLALVQKLTEISKRKKVSSIQRNEEEFPPSRVNLQKYIRRRRWEEIHSENTKISQRISSVSCSMSHKRLAQDFLTQQRYVHLGSRAHLAQMVQRIIRSRFSSPLRRSAVGQKVKAAVERKKEEGKAQVPKLELKNCFATQGDE